MSGAGSKLFLSLQHGQQSIFIDHARDKPLENVKNC